MKSRQSIISNLAWRFLERMGVQGVAFIVSIILGRLLDPAVYGTIAIVTVFTTILQVFVDSGLGTALVQKKDVDNIDFSTVFFFNIGMSLVLYGIIFAGAPLIARFYSMPELIPLIRVLGLSLLISGVNNIQQSYIARNMLFRRSFFSVTGATFVSAIIGIYMAYRGFGVWALVGQALSSNLVSVIILWVTVKWRPERAFSFSRLKGLFSYGWKLLVSSLLNTVYNDIRQLVIGKMYSSADLAYYNKGQQLPQLVVNNVNTAIDSILLPVMSEQQDNKERVRAMTRRAIKTSSYVMMPMMVGLAVCAEPLITILLTEKWLPCVFYLRIFCILLSFNTIHTANLNAIKAMGRSDLFLKLEIIKKVIGLSTLLATMWISPEAMAWSLLGTTLIYQIVNAFPNKKLLGYGYLEQLKDLAPQLALSVLMGGIVLAVSFLNIHDYLILLIQIPLGVAVYLAGSVVFRLESFRYIVSVIKGFIRK